MRYLPLLLICGLMAGCLSQSVDHFYTLTPLPGGSQEARSTFAAQVRLTVSIPTIVDRSEMVVKAPAGIVVLEHQRWASPLADQIKTVLGQDVEARRPDSLVVTHLLTKPNLPTVNVAVEIVSLSIARGAQSTLEARWRIQREGAESAQGREIFEAPVGNAGYEEVAHALSGCVAKLADRLVREWPAAGG